MLLGTVQLYFALPVICLFVLSTLFLQVNCKLYQRKDANTHNKTNSHERSSKGFVQKKPRSAQFGFLPQYNPVYSRQSVPVRLSSIPASSYRLPGVQRLGNLRSLAQLPGLQRTYIPMVASSIPRVRYPGVSQQVNPGVGGRYVLPYMLKMPSSRLATEGTNNQEFAKHYNEKYDTLPSVSNADKDTVNQGGKVESKKLDLDDDFDHFLDSLDGPCSRNPCRNGAKCRISRDGTSFYCICRRGFKGKTCKDKNPCHPNPCQNDGECTLTSEGFECSCPKGYNGKRCQQQNKCEPNPCANDGICNEIKNGEFECTCKKGFFGDKCQVSKKGCSPNPCLHDGRCSEHENGDYECSCANGYTGKTCDSADNKCIMNPCKNGGSCLQAITSIGYECTCPRGFRGQNCEDHSGCDLNSCENGGTCYETEFGVRCICKNGYSGDRCRVRRFCEPDTCENNGKCREHATGFYCKCSAGYKGKTCEEIDRCHPNPCQHAGECEQSETGYFCKCSSQYQGENCEVQNPCSQNPCKNGGKCLAALDGVGYQCECNNGYHGNICEERNACELNPCGNNGVCQRKGNGFLCDCQDGFEGKSCQIKDPCRVNPCENGGRCKRSGETEYTCSCAEDFKGFHCEARKPCHPNPCMNNGACEESDDDFTCSCREGFRGTKCEEQDQCFLNPCKNGGRCTLMSASNNGKAFTCECVNSFYGDTCEERNPCHPNPCANNGQCTDVNGGFTCHCSAGFKGDRCHEIDKCSPSPCHHGGVCTEVIGGLGYACRCAYGYKGQDCEQKEHCHPNPCDHDGQCVALDNDQGFQCKCSYGYQGPRCSDINPCKPNPCQHDSQCIILPGFGANHVCNCTIGWSGETCHKREICKPNPCQYGTKCVQTGNDSYSCVKSICHPSPCQNSGKCVNVNDNDFQCACTDDFEGKICEGDNVSTDLGHRTNDMQNFETKSGNKPKTTNIDNLLNLIDTTLDAYNSKHTSKPKAKDKIVQVTALLDKVKTYSNNKPIKLQLDNGDDTSTTTDDEFTTKRDQTTKQHNVLHSDDATEQVADATSNLMGLNDDYAKSINPNGEVVVDKARLSTARSEKSSGKNALHLGVNVMGDKRNKLKTQTDMKQNYLEDSILNELQDEEAFIKSINPEGQVVINNGKEVPRRRPNQLSYVPASPPSIDSQLSEVTNSNPPQDSPLTGNPRRLPMNTIASCSPSLCQNGGVCVQEQGKTIRCKCKPSFTGEKCEVIKCRKNPCQNDGMCLPVEREPGFVCKCRDGLAGLLCSRKPCKPNPCKNGGDCLTFYSVYLCKCKPGFDGKHCEGGTLSTKSQAPLESKENQTAQSQTAQSQTAQSQTAQSKTAQSKTAQSKTAQSKTAQSQTAQSQTAQSQTAQSSPSKDDKVSVCNRNPCQNNAQCLESSDGEFQCICSSDFSGPQCEDEGRLKYSSAPKFFPGENEECKHCDKNARCVNGHCICRNKFVGDGLECWKKSQRDQQWSCDHDPCQNGGTCKPGISRCVCRLGYVGDYCEEYSPPVVNLKFEKLVDGHKLMDSTGNGNDAVVLNGFQIAPKQGKCENGGNMLGGDVLFDGETFKGIPRRAITIAAWVKLTTSLGIQSIFDTIGSHSAHKDGQYHFEIDNGRVRWFHRDEMGKTVFSVVTDQPVITQSNWTLITGTYSSKEKRARIFVNGDLIKEKATHGTLLSGDWGAKAGIATLTELDVPINDEDDANTNGVDKNNNNIYQSLTDNDNSENDDDDDNNINPVIFKRNIFNTNSKHEHPYGARVLRGMVDEFSIFASELSRLQILVLMKHCKIYYNRIKQTSKTASKTASPKVPQESYTELPPTSISSYEPTTNQAMSSEQQLTTATRYPGYTATSSKPLQPPYYQAPTNGYLRNSHYSNTASSPDKPTITGYQRTLKPPQYTTGYPRTIERPKNPVLSLYAQGFSGTGIPTQAGYKKTQNPAVSPYALQVSPYAQGVPGYVKTQTPKGPVVNQYASGWMNTRQQEQVGSIRTQTPQLAIDTPHAPSYYGGPSVSNLYQAQANFVPSYNGYITAPNQQANTYYSTPQPPAARSGAKYDVTGTGSTSQETGSVRSQQYSAQVSNKQVPYQLSQTNTALGGNDYTSMPQTNPSARYTTPQNGNTAWAGQYQTIVPSRMGSGGPGSERSWPQRSAPMTSSPDVRSTTSYRSGLPSQPQNAYARTDIYPNLNNSPPVHVNNQMLPRDQVTNMANSQNSPPKAGTTQGQVNGPIYNGNQYNPIYNKQLDNNGQYPSVVQQYKNIPSKSRTNDNVASRTFGTSGANTAPPSSSSSQWSGYSKNGNMIGNSQVGSQTGYNSWPTAAQAPIGTNQWRPSSPQNAKVDETVMYNNEANTKTSQMTATPTATTVGTQKIPLTKNIDMDSVVQRAFADIFTTNFARKKKKRKKRQDNDGGNMGTKLWR